MTLAEHQRRRLAAGQVGTAILLADYPHLRPVVDRVLPVTPIRQLDQLARRAELDRAIVALRVLNAHRALQRDAAILAVEPDNLAVRADVARITAQLAAIERDGRMPNLPWQAILDREEHLPPRRSR